MGFQCLFVSSCSLNDKHSPSTVLTVNRGELDAMAEPGEEPGMLHDAPKHVVTGDEPCVQPRMSIMSTPRRKKHLVSLHAPSTWKKP